MTTWIIIEFSGSVHLTPEEVWPDGDIPDPITAAAARDAIRGQDSYKQRVLDEWDLTSAIEVNVAVDGTYEKVW